MPIVRINLNIIKRRIKRRAVSFVLAGLAVAAGGCAARLPEPGAADAMRAARLWPGTTVDDLHRGKQRYVQACSGCHGLFDPHEFASGRWPGFVKEMSGRLQLTSDELADLTRYLVVASEAPPAAHWPRGQSRRRCGWATSRRAFDFDIENHFQLH